MLKNQVIFIIFIYFYKKRQILFLYFISVNEDVIKNTKKARLSKHYLNEGKYFINYSEYYQIQFKIILFKFRKRKGRSIHKKNTK